MNELFLKKELNTPLNEYFKKNGLNTSWDYDSYYRWIEVYWNNKMIIEIDEKASVDDFVNLMVKHINCMESGENFYPDFFLATESTAEELKDFGLLFEEVKVKLNINI